MRSCQDPLRHMDRGLWALAQIGSGKEGLASIPTSLTNSSTNRTVWKVSSYLQSLDSVKIEKNIIATSLVKGVTYWNNLVKFIQCTFTMVIILSTVCCTKSLKLTCSKVKYCNFVDNCTLRHLHSVQISSLSNSLNVAVPVAKWTKFAV